MAGELRNWLLGRNGDGGMPATYSDLFCPFFHEVFETNFDRQRRAAWPEVLGDDLWDRLVVAYRVETALAGAATPTSAYFGPAAQNDLLDIAPGHRAELEWRVFDLQQAERDRLAGASVGGDGAAAADGFSFAVGFDTTRGIHMDSI
eukprot:SAG22_NODE_272_length_13192_cov_311.812495_8_plen_147_part_00